MNRRKFLSSSGGVALGLAVGGDSAGAAPIPKAVAPERVLMKLGCQSAPTNDTHLKDLAGKNGIEIDCVGPPVLESTYIDNEKHPAIMLAKSPERDRDIESIQTMIRNCAQAGLPSIKYNMSILGVLRT